MRKWMKRIAVLGIIIWVSGGLDFANAAEIVTLEPGQDYTVVTCETELRTITSVDADCGHLEFAIYEDTTICDTVIYRAVEVDTIWDRRVVYKYPFDDSPLDSVPYLQTTEALRYECKKPCEGHCWVRNPDHTHACTHPECAPCPKAIFDDPRMSDIMENIIEELDKLVPTKEPTDKGGGK